MSGEPPEGTSPTLAADGSAEAPRPARTVPRPAPRAAGVEVGVVPTEGPPQIDRILAGPVSEASPPSSAPDSGAGANRRRSRRTVKIPNDAVPQGSAVAAPPAEPAAAEGAAAATPAATNGKDPPSAVPRLTPPPPPPPVPPRPVFTVPRPVPKGSPSVPAMQATPAPEETAAPKPSPEAAASASPPAEEVFEVIRPMRIISIGTAPLSTPEPPPPVVDDGAWDDAAAKPAAPVHPALNAPSAPPAPKPPVIEEVEAIEEVEEHAAEAAPAVTKGAPPPPPPAPPPRGATTDEIEPIPVDAEDEEPPAAAAPVAAVAAPPPPRGATTDEIEPIPVETEDEEPAAQAARRSMPGDDGEPIPIETEDEAEDRISDVDIASPAGAAGDGGGDLGAEAARPKKPPPPPLKRPTAMDPSPLSGVAGVAGVTSARAVEITPLAPAPEAAAPPAVSAPAAPAASPPPATAPAAPVAAAAPASPAPVQTVDLAGKKRQKPWWEEIFSDDYIRTMERVEPRVIRKECDFIEDRLGLEKGAVMLDLACGAGMHAVELASRGYNVVGYDLSLAMLARAQDEAQERGQRINFLQGDMREMAFEEAFDGMYSWSTSFGYFDDEKNLAVLSRIHRGLRQGGMFLLDIINRDYVCPRQPSLVWFEGDGCVCMDEMFVDFFTSRLRVKRTVMFEDGRSRECDYGIRLYGLHELGRMLHDTGFKVVEVTGHPAHPGVFFGSESPRIIILAERG